MTPYTHAGTVAGHEFSTAIRGLAIDAADRLYVAGDTVVKAFDERGRLAREWRTAGPAWSVAVDQTGKVLAGGEGQIEVFEPGGRLLETWRHAKRLGRVTAIGFTGGHVLAGDATGRAIRRFEPDGRFVNDIGTAGRMQGFLIPNGVVQFGVDDKGLIHAANPGKHRVERYSADGELLGHIGRFDGNDPAGFGGCCNPTNVTVAGNRIYVTEKGEPRAKVYEPDGRLGAVIAATLFDANCKNMAIAVASRGRVYVADTARRHVLVFEPSRGSAS